MSLYNNWLRNKKNGSNILVCLFVCCLFFFSGHEKCNLCKYIKFVMYKAIAMTICICFVFLLIFWIDLHVRTLLSTAKTEYHGQHLSLHLLVQHVLQMIRRHYHSCSLLRLIATIQQNVEIK